MNDTAWTLHPFPTEAPVIAVGFCRRCHRFAAPSAPLRDGICPPCRAVQPTRGRSALGIELHPAYVEKAD